LENEVRWHGRLFPVAAATDAPLWLAGYSFGAAVALDVAHPRIDGWLAVAPPLAVMPGPRIAGADHRPKHLLVPGHDQFSPPDATAEAVAEWRNTDTTVLPSADHFLAGHLAQVVAWASTVRG
jgi:alpha/beta superfamily hydrolase